MQRQFIILLLKIVAGFIVTFGIFTSYAIGVDTFNIAQYKIKDRQIKQCLSQIAKEERGRYNRQIEFILVNYTQKNKEYLFVGCNTLAWMSFYRFFYEVEDNDFVGCAYFKHSTCFLFGKDINQYLSDSLGTTSLIDSNFILKPLLGNKDAFNEWKEELYRIYFHYDPPVWIFRKQKGKFVRIKNDEHDYDPTTLPYNVPEN